MKLNVLMLLLFVFGLPLVLQGQDDTKTKIQSVITDRYPGFVIDEMEKESWCNGETLLEVEIEKGEEDQEEEMTLLFSSTGQLRYRETSIKPADLPQVVTDAFRTACPECKDPQEVDKLTALDGGETLYEIEGRKGLREFELIIKENGKLVCRK